MFVFNKDWVTVNVDDNGVVYKAIIPGVDKKNISISVTNDKLKIETDEKTEFGTKFSYVDEYEYGKYYQIDNSKATLKNGVLTITIPKKQLSKQEVNYIKID